MKKDERRAIIERLGSEIGMSDATVLRGRKVEKVKLNRWRRLEEGVTENPSSDKNESTDHSGSPPPVIECIIVLICKFKEIIRSWSKALKHHCRELQIAMRRR